MKYTLLLLGALLTAATAQAQFGLRAGANASVLTTRNEEEGRSARSGGRVGYQLGVLYEHKLTEHLSVVPEVAYSRLSSRVEVEDFTIADGGYSADYRLGRSYLNVPVLMRITFGRFYLDAGPQASFLLSAHEKGTESIGSIAGSYEQTFDRAATDRYRRFDVGVSAGVGMRLPAGFALDLRSTSGLVSLTHEDQPTNFYRGKLRNAVWQASVSYQFRPKVRS